MLLKKIWCIFGHKSWLEVSIKFDVRKVRGLWNKITTRKMTVIDDCNSAQFTDYIDHQYHFWSFQRKNIFQRKSIFLGILVSIIPCGSLFGNFLGTNSRLKKFPTILTFRSKKSSTVPYLQYNVIIIFLHS